MGVFKDSKLIFFWTVKMQTKKKNEILMLINCFNINKMQYSSNIVKVWLKISKIQSSVTKNCHSPSPIKLNTIRSRLSLFSENRLSTQVRCKLMWTLISEHFLPSRFNFINILGTAFAPTVLRQQSCANSLVPTVLCQ